MFFNRLEGCCFKLQALCRAHPLGHYIAFNNLFKRIANLESIQAVPTLLLAVVPLPSTGFNVISVKDRTVTSGYRFGKATVTDCIASNLLF